MSSMPGSSTAAPGSSGAPGSEQRCFPQFGEDLALRTFCSGIGRFCAERRTAISGPSASVETVATWVALDPERLVPMRFDEEFAALYGASAAGRGASTRLHHPGPPPDAASEPWAFRATDLDLAGHVNNSHYWAALETELSGDGDPGAVDAEIEHLAPGLPGAEATILRSLGWAWIVDPPVPCWPRSGASPQGPEGESGFGPKGGTARRARRARRAPRPLRARGASGCAPRRRGARRRRRTGRRAALLRRRRGGDAPALPSRAPGAAG